jgi:hypothetical protein
MTTYATMRSRIEDEIYDATITTSVNSAILDAIKFYERKRFWFNQKTGAFSTVADQEYYATAANSDIPDLLHIKAMTATIDSYKTPVRPADFNWIDAAQNGAIKGFPAAFAYFNEQVRLFPIPDAVYTVTMAYHYRFAALSADADTNAWTTDAEELIRTRAKRILAMHKLWDVEMYTRLREPEQEALDALEAETRRRMSNETLMSDYPVNSRSFDIRIG